MKKVKAAAIVALLGLVAIFAIQNITRIEIQFLVWSFSLPRSLLVVLLLGIGFLVGLLVSSMSVLKGAWKRKSGSNGSDSKNPQGT